MKHLLFFFLIPILSFAQISDSKDITYEVGAPYPVVDAYAKLYFYQEGDILTFKAKKNEYIIQKIDPQTLKFKSVRNYKNLPKGHVFEAIKQINDKIYFFYSLVEKSSATEQLFYKEIDFATGKMSSETTRLLKTKQKVVRYFYGSTDFNIRNVNKFDVTFSNDESTIMVKYRLKSKMIKDPFYHDVIGFYVFDIEMNLIWNEEVEMPYPKNKMENVDYAMDSYGNAYFLSAVYKVDYNIIKLSPIKIDNTPHLELMKVDAETQKLSNIKIGLEDKFIQSAWIYESTKGKMVCAGSFNSF